MAAPLQSRYVQQWALGFGHQLAKSSLLKISYVANKGTHQLRPLNLDNPVPRAAAGAITERQPTANSNYNSLRVNFTRRMARSFTVTTSYTFSKSIDNASSDRGVCDFDRTHILTAGYIYETQRITRRRVAGLLVNGWQVSGITRMNSGPAFDVVMPQDLAGIGATQNQRPNLIAPVRHTKTVEQWFSVGSFGRPAPGTFGNLGRNTLRRPGIHRWDASIMKNFYPVENRQRYLQFRAEFFNAPNHPSFATSGRH